MKPGWDTRLQTAADGHVEEKVMGYDKDTSLSAEKVGM
jgi:hypothetical protein